MENNRTNYYPEYDEEINFKEIFIALWNKKALISIITLVFAIFSVFYALSLPNIYSSDAVLAPSSETSSLSSKLGGLSSFAGLAGVSLPSDSGSPTIEAIERMTSLDFFSKYILPNIQLENLLAVESWSRNTNKILYDEDIYNVTSKKWVRKVKPPKSIEPSDQEAYRAFKKIFSVTVNKKNDYVNISLKHKSPYVAKKWADLIILNINESMRDEKRQLAENSIIFLNEMSSSANLASIRKAIAQLIENQIQNLMMVSSNKDYIFKTIDSPRVAEIKFSPNRATICMSITFIGVVISLIIALMLHFLRKPEEQ
jgi:capsular polysaccharide biosynthesis protein